MTDEKKTNAPEGDEGDTSELWRLLSGSEEVDKDQATGTSAQQTTTSTPPPGVTRKEAEYVYRGEAEPVPDGFTELGTKPGEQPDTSERFSDLQKILSNPDLVGDDVDFRSQDAIAEDDFDSAVMNFYREDRVELKCKNHPEKQAASQCPECQAYYCQDCLVVRAGRLLCSDCADTLFVPTEEEILSAAEQGEDAKGAGVELPEHPEFQVGTGAFGAEGRPAHPLKRLLALLIDLLITRSIVFIILFAFSGVISKTYPMLAIFDMGLEGPALTIGILKSFFLFIPPVPWLVVFAIVDFLYFFLTMSFANRTLGMSWLGCRLVSEWGEFVTFGGVALRTLVFMIMLGIPAILLSFFFPVYRGLHDYAAGTIVINYAGVKRVDAYETIQIKL